MRGLLKTGEGRLRDGTMKKNRTAALFLILALLLSSCGIITFRGGEELAVCGMRFGVLATPGHTAGSCCFLTDGAIFTGDTLMRRSFGRCDLPTGNVSAMKRSLARLANLENRTVYPGHGMPTTLEEEKKYGYLHV